MAGAWRRLVSALGLEHGVSARFILLLTIPSLSDDIYRYIWDGHVAINGFSPYAFAVNDHTLDFLSIPERDLANNAWMASPYLPAAQLLFFLAALIGRNPILLQGTMPPHQKYGNVLSSSLVSKLTT